MLKTTFFIDGKDVNDGDDADNNLSNYESNHACVKADIKLLDVYFLIMVSCKMWYMKNRFLSLYLEVYSFVKHKRHIQNPTKHLR